MGDFPASTFAFADVKVQMRMQMQVEWACSKALLNIHYGQVSPVAARRRQSYTEESAAAAAAYDFRVWS